MPVASSYASSENPSFEIASSALPSKQVFNRIILYSAGSSFTSTILSKVTQKFLNLLLSPLNFGNLILFYISVHSTPSTGTPLVLFEFEAFTSWRSFLDPAAPINEALDVNEDKNSECCNFHVGLLYDFV